MSEFESAIADKVVSLDSNPLFAMMSPPLASNVEGRNALH